MFARAKHSSLFRRSADGEKKGYNVLDLSSASKHAGNEGSEVNTDDLDGSQVANLAAIIKNTGNYPFSFSVERYY
jgi:hypothetical protein